MTGKPWLEHDDWPRTLRSDSRRGMFAMWGFAGFWNLVSLPLWFVIPEEVAAGNQAALVGLVF
ncbi:MAG: hypothetical protein OES38_16705, partial [Gammaproteobacteria bacterium]|nr:hypothetical protein [Gammaproteobacteria bacterium]